MNVMSEAFVQAGFKKVPNIKRIWLWLKDHPEKTAKEIAAATGINIGSVGSCMVDLELRKMVTVYSDMSRHTHPWTKQQLKIKRYSVVGTEYELLPRPLKQKPVVTAPAVVDPPAKPAAKRRGRPPKSDAVDPNSRHTVQIPPSLTEEIDESIRQFDEQHGIVLSRVQMLTAMVRFYRKCNK